ncbi:MAG: hypothetical protein CVV27_10020 [Candidatus Melainabacteria bacterium HGW-Melainabacteria-1]|nr:MAG: hypothetical protein CVV27_10020 [Candidatus Melainabacteria bacterium HGW-Melainabacteria-1]
MPYVTPKPGTGMLPPLPATNQPGQTKPATQAAQTAPTQTAPNNVGPRDANAVATQQGSSVPSIMLVVEEPLPPALLKKGENSPAHAELNKLLLGIGQIKVLGSGYTESTEAAIKTFQRNNGLRETGEVDEKTLRKLIDACKENDSNYPQLLALLSSGEAEGDDVDVEGVAEAAGVAEPEPVVYANDFERVKAMVANQISEKGGDPEQAFEVGTQLTDHAKNGIGACPAAPCATRPSSAPSTTP